MKALITLRTGVGCATLAVLVACSSNGETSRDALIEATGCSNPQIEALPLAPKVEQVLCDNEVEIQVGPTDEFRTWYEQVDELIPGEYAYGANWLVVGAGADLDQLIEKFDGQRGGT